MRNLQPLPVMRTERSVMPENPKNGDLLVCHVYESQFEGLVTHHYPVRNVKVAKVLIKNKAKEQVDDESIHFNTFSLIEYDESEKDWMDWYNEEYESITEEMDRELEESC